MIVGRKWTSAVIVFLLSCGLWASTDVAAEPPARAFNGPYSGRHLNRVAFPVGGIGAGMFCVEGSGAISHMSVRHKPEVFNEPAVFAAICVLGEGDRENIARVVEGPIPDWKYFGQPGSGNGGTGTTYGLPRFRRAEFSARFPFATINLSDASVPLDVELTAWSPFTPPEADPSSLPVGAMEYRFINNTDRPLRAVFSFNARNFMGNGPIEPIAGGFVLQAADPEKTDQRGEFAVFADDQRTVVDHCWFRGGWWDPLTIAWHNVERGVPLNNPPEQGNTPGASLAVPFELKPGESKTVRLLACWHVPTTGIRQCKCANGECPPDAPKTYVPWYAKQFADVRAVADHWRSHYAEYRRRSETFRDAFYDSTLPPEVLEAVAANLTILKSPTMLRQHDGRLWCWEGCCDSTGCCAGTCTHVWNYAQALCHLFPALERTLRQTEYHESQDAAGRQAFRANLPIQPGGLAFDASDGQLGGIMKVYREWRISGDNDWLAEYWPLVKKSLDYSIAKWDPRHTGLLEESHHNTYDINYFGPDGHCGSFYLGALAAAVEMGNTIGDDVALYRQLLDKGRRRMESELFNGEYFIQIVMKDGLTQNFSPLNPKAQSEAYRSISEEVNRQGPKYQYGSGCLADGVLGLWIAAAAGIDRPLVDPAKVRSHLLAVYRHNLNRDLSAHANPQRPTFAMGDEGGLLLCTWPRGGKPLLPFVYSDEAWTGIEYQVASHLMMHGCVQEGLDIVRTARLRYDGVRRNPFNEYECGHWYARALASYGLLQGLTGLRYDAVSKTLYVDSRIGDFRGFLAAAGGFGVVELKDGRATLEVRHGEIPVEKTVVGPAAGQSHAEPAAQTDPIDHSNLMEYLSADGRLLPVRTAEDWSLRRRQIISGMESAMGRLPDRANLPAPETKLVVRTEHDDFTRLEIKYLAEPDEWVPALLYLPKDRPSGGRLPAVLALHPTSRQGKKTLAVEDNAPANRGYATELARRGYVVLAPDYPSFGDYACDFGAGKYASGTMKGIFNHMRGVDLLAAREDVDPRRIGAIGHSLGGHNAMFLGAFDERVKAVVASCGWTPFHYYYGGKLDGWAQHRYMPRIRECYDLNPDRMPFDFYEAAAALAPRAFLSCSPLRDDNFDVAGVKTAEPKIRQVFALLGAADRLRFAYPDCEHDFPPETRAEAYRFLDQMLR